MLATQMQDAFNTFSGREYDFINIIGKKTEVPNQALIHWFQALDIFKIPTARFLPLF